MSEILADADGVALLFDGGIRDEFGQPLVRTFKAKTSHTHLRMNMNFFVGSSFDGDIASSARQFQANGSRHVQSAFKAASCGRSEGASREHQSDGKRSHWCGELTASRHRSSV